jgi:hypothetical protein
LDRSLLSIAIDNFLAFSRDQQTAAEVAQMKDKMVASTRPPISGSNFRVNARQDPLSSSDQYPTKRTLADAAGKAGDADRGRHARQHVKKLVGHRAAIVRVNRSLLGWGITLSPITRERELEPLTGASCDCANMI